ncbi:MAG: GNAT family N-acetyltransferase [Coriobacteriales bacterium]|nr:GNAT family N-acetyltransferase [Coriobacteriales bacterium]
MGELAFTKPRPLEDSDVLDDFRCGLPMVDEWVHKRARMARKAGTAVMYVSFLGDRMAGFYTLSSQSMVRSDVRGWLSRNTPEQIPVILLGMLGVDERFQGHGLGKNLLLDASKRALLVSQAIGARALVVDPASDAAASLYRSSGFKEVPGSSRMYARMR